MVDGPRGLQGRAAGRARRHPRAAPRGRGQARAAGDAQDQGAPARGADDLQHAALGRVAPAPPRHARYRDARAARAPAPQRGDRDGRGARVRLRRRERGRPDRRDRPGDRIDHREGGEAAAALRALTANRTAEVAVFAGLRGPARTFSYRIPEGLEVRPGHLVRAGFGARAVHGVVIALDVPSDRELKPVDGLVHPLPLLSDRQLALARWMAATYRCGLADAVRAMLPPALAARARGGLPTARGERTEPVFAITPAGREALEAAGSKLGGRQLATLRALAAGAITSGDLAEAGGTAEAAKSLAGRGLAVRGSRGVRRVPVEFRLSEADLAKDLPATDPQAAAIAKVIAGMGSGRGFLLHGVTGSGKTEVYLRSTAEALARGRGAIVLVPEIALTAQVVARFVARFGERVALLHSALSAGERYDEWRRVLDGTADVVVGSRSALFAPLERLGLIVVDEEQEPSSKQESAPRYHAVDAAPALGRLSGAAAVLGSAPPGVVTYAAATAGALTSLPLPERVLDLPLPKTTVVDLRLELKANNRSTLSAALRRALL